LILASLEFIHGCHLVVRRRFVLLSCRELQEPIESGGNRFDHFNLLFLLGACARRYQVCGLANEVNNSSSKLVCLERWVNDEGSVVVLNSLAITFQIFKDSSTVEEKIWVGLN
jgi:hypothetical protein